MPMKYEWDCKTCGEKNVQVMKHKHFNPDHCVIRGKGIVIDE